jgi:hypothetical protein
MFQGGAELLEDDQGGDIDDALLEVDMAHIGAMKQVYDHVTNSFPLTLGKSVSKKDREEQGKKETNLVYGEVSFEAFGIIMEKIIKVYGRQDVGASGPYGVLQGRGGTFYDLGAGAGKAVCAAAILHNFDQCTGIECLEGLYSLSLELLASYNTRGKTKLEDREFDTHCSFLYGSFLDMSVRDWRDGDLVFANSTCYDDELMANIADLALGMKKGSFFVSFTKRLASTDFQIVDHEMYKMSWGEVTVYIMQKMTDPKESKFALEKEGDDE